MGFAILAHFTLHLTHRRVEMKNVKVLKVNNSLYLVGTVKAEATASLLPNNMVFKTKKAEEYDDIIRLSLDHSGGVLAFGTSSSEPFLGTVIWDTALNHLKLPDFMRRLLSVTP